jgi:hypothetical protein
LDTSASQHQQERLLPTSHLLAVGGYTVLILLLTYPIALRLSSEVLGGGDAWHNIWNLWWVKQALVDRHINPYYTDMLYYPGGANLYFHTLTPTAGLISLPLQLLGFNLVTTYNLVLLSSFVLAGYGAFLLCHYLTGSRWASFVGGAVFAFSPYHFAHLLGHMNLVSLQWIPFFVLLLLKAVDQPALGRPKEALLTASANELPPESEANGLVGHQPVRPGTSDSPGNPLFYTAGAGALLAVNAYTDWQYAIFLIMFTGLLLAWRLLVAPERRRFREAGVGWVEGGMRVLVGASVFLLLVGPVLLPSLAEAQKGYAEQSANETLIYSSDVMLAFTPSELHPIWGEAVTERVASLGPYMPQKPASERVVFVGYCVLALGIYAAWRLRAKLQVRFWIFAAIATWVLSLGPILQVFGKSRIPLLGVPMPLPYALLYQLPLLNIARTPSRLAVLTMLAMGVLAAFALAAVLSRKRKRSRVKAARTFDRGHAAIAAGLPLLILFEFLAIPFPTVPPGWEVPIYRQIAAEPGRFALLELPLRPVGDYMAYQTIHGKPIIGGFLARQPPDPILEQTPALTYLLDNSAPSGPLQDRVAHGKGVQALREMGVKYVIMHWWLLKPEEKSSMETKLTTLLGRPPDFEYPANEMVVWQLQP